MSKKIQSYFLPLSLVNINKNYLTIYILFRVLEYIKSGIDTNIIDPTPEKKFLREKARRNGWIIRTYPSTTVNAYDPYLVKGNFKMQVDGWTKILENLPAISNTEIDLFFEESASKIINSASVIKKNHLRGESFIIEKFIDTETVFSKQNEKYFYLKGYCSASKKQREYCLSLAINKISKNIAYAFCECPAGSGGLCSHSFALMKLAASWSVQSLKYIPDEISCTAKPCLWSQRKSTNIKLNVLNSTGIMTP